MENIQNKRTNTPSPIQYLFRFVRNVTIIVLLLAVCFVAAVVLLHKDPPAVNQAELASIKVGLEKALAQPVWQIRRYKDPMQDISFTRLEIVASQTLGLSGSLPRLTLECDPTKNGDKQLYLTISSEQRITYDDAIGVYLKFDDEETSKRFEFSADSTGKQLRPEVEQSGLIQKLLAANKLRAEIYPRHGETIFFSFGLSPQSMAQNYVKDCSNARKSPAAVEVKE